MGLMWVDGHRQTLVLKGGEGGQCGGGYDTRECGDECTWVSGVAAASSCGGDGPGGACVAIAMRGQ